MITLKSLVKEYDNYFFNMYYDKAKQLVGKMRINNYNNQADYYEALIYFECGEYEKIYHLLKNKREKTNYESELLIYSLLELKMYDEFYRECDELELMSVYTYAYIHGIVLYRDLEVDREKLERINVCSDYCRYMFRKSIWFIVNTIADIHYINEEKIQMEEAGMRKTDISFLEKLIKNRMDCLEIIKNIPEWDKICECVKKKKHINPDSICFCAILLCGDKNDDGLTKIINSFSCIYDFINYYNLCKKIGKKGYVLSFITENKGMVINALEFGNNYMIDLMKKMYIDISFSKDEENISILSDLIWNMLKKGAPYALKDIEENHINDKRIDSILSIKGKFAYKAALCQYENSIKSRYGSLDAGMLCLSYMRILELELNEKLINIALLNKEKIVSLYEEKKKDIEEKYELFLNICDNKKEELKKDHKVAWGKMITSIKTKNKKDGLEMGPLYYMLLLLSDEEYDEKDPYWILAKRIRKYFLELLSEEGKKALIDGRLAKMIDNEARNKYRNPPAHTKYVSMDVAMDCRRHVEECIIMLDSYFLK